MTIRQFGLSLIVALALSACSQDDTPEAVRRPEPTAFRGVLVAMGDSLTAGYGLNEDEAYPALLQAQLNAGGYDWKVVNAGISGETSSGALSRLDWVLFHLKPDIVVLTTGANDGLRGIDPSLVRQNLLAMVQRLHEAGVAVILGGMRMVGNLGAGYTQVFEAVYPSVAEATGARLIPFFLEGVAADPRYNLADGIHPNAAGYRRIVERIYPVVTEAIDEVQRQGR
jgi:acyl-CoA thioesterase-1